MEVNQAPSGPRGFGRWTRFGLVVQVLLLTVLVVAGALFVLEAADSRSLRWRIDLTAGAQNTLDPETVRILEEVTSDGTVLHLDYFPRGLEFDPTLGELVQDRVAEFLLLLSETLGDSVVVAWHDYRDVEPTRARMAELGLKNADAVLVVSRGERRFGLRVYRDLVELDRGSSTGMGSTAGRISAFHGEQALLRAVAQVLERPLVVFTRGSGEPGFGEDSDKALEPLAQELLAEGFDVLGWDPRGSEPLPESTAVVAVVAPRLPLGEETVESLAEWANGGGRLVALLGPEVQRDAAGAPLPGTVDDLLARFGMESEPGLVCMPVLQVGVGLVEEVPQCATLELGARSRSFSPHHPITELLSQSDVRVRADRSHSLKRGKSVRPDPVLDLLVTPDVAWIDLPDARGRYDYYLDQRRGERVGGFYLALATSFRIASDASAQDADSQDADSQAAERPEESGQGRIVGIGAPHLFDAGDFATYNRDFVLNVFQWLAERESHVRVRPRTPGSSRVEVLRGPTLARFQGFAWWGLSGGCLALGVLLGWRRRH